MARGMRQMMPWLGAAGIAGCFAGALVVLGNHPNSGPRDDAVDSSAPATPTRAQAEALLREASRLAQAHDYRGLCQAVAQDQAACSEVVQWAADANAVPAAKIPAIVGASNLPGTAGLTQGAEVLHIQGSRADGSTYTSDFSAVRTTDGQIRSQNAVYWFSTYSSS